MNKNNFYKPLKQIQSNVAPLMHEVLINNEM